MKELFYIVCPFCKHGFEIELETYIEDHCTCPNCKNIMHLCYDDVNDDDSDDSYVCCFAEINMR